MTFHRGLNTIISENNSGKTAVIDALKLVLVSLALCSSIAVLKFYYNKLTAEKRKAVMLP